MLQTRDVAVAVAVPVSIEVAVPVAVAVAAPLTRARVRDTFLSKPLSPVSPRARKIALDVGGVVHPIPPHPTLIKWLEG